MDVSETIGSIEVCTTLSAMDHTKLDFHVVVTLRNNTGTMMVIMYMYIVYTYVAGFSGLDYGANREYLQRFLSGSVDGSSRCIDISIINNNFWEGNRDFFLELTTVYRSYPFVLIKNNVSVVTIFDDESKHCNKFNNTNLEPFSIHRYKCDFTIREHCYQ